MNALDDYKAARKQLEAVTKNSKGANEAMKKVPWWRR